MKKVNLNPFGPILVLGLLASLLWSCSPTNSPSGTSGGKGEPKEFTSNLSCQEFVASLPESYQYGWIEVPENYSSQSGIKLKIFWYAPKQLKSKVAIFFNGGPSSSSHGVQQSLDRSLQKFGYQDDLSFVFMDQRGTGCSTAYPEIEQPEISSADYFPRSVNYGSRQIVLDAEMLRKQLIGNKKWMAFGQSFGAFIVHRYVAQAPESLHGAFAHAGAVTSNPVIRHTNRIASQLQAWEYFFKLYPSLKAKMTAVSEKLNDKSFCLKGSDQENYCGKEILEPMLGLLGFSNLRPRLAEWINKIVSEDLLVSESVLDDFLKESTYNPDPSELSYTFKVIALNDWNTAGSSYSDCAKVLDNLKIDLMSQMPTECTASIQMRYPESQFRQRTMNYLNGQTDILTIQQVSLGLNKMSEKSFYLYSGELDTYVPKENMQEELAIFGDKINYVHFPNSGHEGYRTEKKVFDDMVSLKSN